VTPLPERLGAVLASRYRLDRELGAGGMATVLQGLRIVTLADSGASAGFQW